MDGILLVIVHGNLFRAPRTNSHIHTFRLAVNVCMDWKRKHFHTYIGALVTNTVKKESFFEKCSVPPFLDASGIQFLRTFS